MIGTEDEQRECGAFNPRGTQEKPRGSPVRYGEAENCPQPAPKAHKILPKGSQKREPKPCQKGVNIEALPEQTDSKKAEQNTNKTPTKNSIF